uniref:Uncharacterized protein n=1 Tax=Ciona intestinalis TaxID=7719 RepID=H2XSD1_CIOIN
MSSPLSLPCSFLEHKVFPVQVHDSNFEVKFPSTFGAMDFIVLTNHHIICVEQFNRVVIRSIISGT